MKASLAGSYGVEVVATVPVASKPSIEDTKKNDDDVILLSREDIEIDDKTTNKAKTPKTSLPETSNIAATMRQPATMMTTQPMLGTVNQVPVLKAIMLQAMQRMTVKVAFLRLRPATRTLSFKIFFAN